MKNKIMNKKAIAPFLIVILFMLFLLIFFGVGIASYLNNIPAPIWIILIIIFILYLLGGKRR